MTHRRHTAAGLGAVLTAGALLLSGCSGTDTTPPSPTATSTSGTSTTPRPGATPSGPATPRPTSTTTPVPGVDDDTGTVPSSCDALLTTSRWQDSFLRTPLNDPAVVGDPITLPKSVFDPVRQPDGTRLYCAWRDPRADVTNVVIDVTVVDPSRASSVLNGLDGFRCEPLAEGRRCQRITTDPQYGVEVGTTSFTRGDIGIEISQANVPTSGLLDDVIAHVF